MTQTISYYIRLADTGLRATCNQISDNLGLSKVSRSLKTAIATIKDLGGIFSSVQSKEPHLLKTSTYFANCCIPAAQTLGLHGLFYLPSVIRYYLPSTSSEQSPETEESAAFYNTALALLIGMSAIAANKVLRRQILETVPESNVQATNELAGACYSSWLISDITEALLACVVDKQLARQVASTLVVISICTNVLEDNHRMAAVIKHMPRARARSLTFVELRFLGLSTIAPLAAICFELPALKKIHYILTPMGAALLFSAKDRGRAELFIAAMDGDERRDRGYDVAPSFFERASFTNITCGMVAGKILGSSWIGGPMAALVAGGINTTAIICKPYVLQSYQNKCRAIFMEARFSARNQALQRVQKIQIHTRKGHLAVFPKEIWEKIIHMADAPVVLPLEDGEQGGRRKFLFLT